MIAFLCIALLTAAMFACWFRYSCLLLLGSRTSTDYSRHVAQASQLALPEILSKLESAHEVEELFACRQALERDYLVVEGLMDQALRSEAALCSQERTLLRLDYALLRLWDNLSCHLLGQPSLPALREISRIVHYFANAAGSAGMLSLQDSSGGVAVSVAAR